MTDEISSKLAPRSISEEQLMCIWRKLLKIDKIGVDDVFFEIGGNNLLASQLIVEINKAFTIKLSTIDLIKNPTISKLISLINRQQKSITAFAKPIIVINNYAPNPIFLVHPVSGLSFCYLALKEFLPNYKIVGINNPNFGHLEKKYKSIEEMAANYIKIIKKFFPNNSPYIMGGWSAGGVIAYEMVQQLKLLGEEVKYLILFDTNNPEMFKDELKNVLNSSKDDLLEEGIKPDSIEGTYFQREIINTLDMLEAYKTPLYDGRVIMFKAQQGEQKSTYEILCGGWNKFLMKPLEIYTVPGSHGKIFFKKNIMHWGDQLKKVLDGTVDNQFIEDKKLSFIDRQLFQAIMNNDVHLLRWILGLKSNLNCISEAGLTPLQYAKEINNSEIEKLLRNYSPPILKKA